LGWSYRRTHPLIEARLLGAAWYWNRRDGVRIWPLKSIPVRKNGAVVLPMYVLWCLGSLPSSSMAVGRVTATDPLPPVSEGPGPLARHWGTTMNGQLGTATHPRNRVRLCVDRKDPMGHGTSVIKDLIHGVVGAQIDPRFKDKATPAPHCCEGSRSELFGENYLSKLTKYVLDFAKSSQNSEPHEGINRERFSRVWLPVVDAFRTFCVNPSPEGSALLSGVRDLIFLGPIGQGSGQGDAGRAMKMRAALFARVSTQHKGQETVNQFRELPECCHAQNLSIFREYEDQESGAKSERTGFQEMLRDVSAYAKLFPIQVHAISAVCTERSA
jgi:hypothetical protein